MFFVMSSLHLFALCDCTCCERVSRAFARRYSYMFFARFLIICISLSFYITSSLHLVCPVNAARGSRALLHAGIPTCFTRAFLKLFTFHCSIVRPHYICVPSAIVRVSRESRALLHTGEFLWLFFTNIPYVSYCACSHRRISIILYYIRLFALRCITYIPIELTIFLFFYITSPSHLSTFCDCTCCERVSRAFAHGCTTISLHYYYFILLYITCIFLLQGSEDP